MVGVLGSLVLVEPKSKDPGDKNSKSVGGGAAGQFFFEWGERVGF